MNDIPAEQVILAGALASRADNNDTIDLAVLGGLKDDQALKTYQVGHFQPFDPVHKRTEADVKGPDGKAFKVTKGAPQVILALSANAGEVKSAVDQGGQRVRGARLSLIGRGAGRGRRSMAVSGCAAAVRSAAGRCQGNDRDRATYGRHGQDGDRRCACHRPGNRQETGDGHKYPRRRQPGRRKAAEDDGGGRRPSRRPTVSPRSSPNTSSTLSMSCNCAATSSA